MHDLFNYFDRIYVINLDRRSDRWRRFVQLLPATWPFGPPLRFSAVDGHLETPPEYWSENRGAWGCYQSHLHALEHAIEHRFERILVLEDDAVCCEDFSDQVRRFIAELPLDWKLIFLGGQHIEVHLGRPKQISEMVYAPYNANRMHAYAFQGAATLREVHAFLSDRANWTALHHVDHFLGA